MRRSVVLRGKPSAQSAEAGAFRGLSAAGSGRAFVMRWFLPPLSGESLRGRLRRRIRRWLRWLRGRRRVRPDGGLAALAMGPVGRPENLGWCACYGLAFLPAGPWPALVLLHWRQKAKIVILLSNHAGDGLCHPSQRLYVESGN